MDIIKDGILCSAVIYDEECDLVTKKAVGEYCLFAAKCFEQDQYARVVLSEQFKNYVIIGSASQAKKFGIIIPEKSFNEDTVYICVKNNVAVISGGKRGIVYAVYEFLERFLGVRFYAPEFIKTPYSRDLSIADFELLYDPPFKFRNVYAFDVRNDADFCARARINSAAQPAMLDAYGGSLDFFKPECHTAFASYINPNDEEIGYKKHPEYFSYIKKEGKRVAEYYRTSGASFWGRGEICWSNPNVADILTEKLKKYIVENPDKSIFSISINDYDEHCECEECTAQALRYGKNGEPCWIAPILITLNKVASNIRNWRKVTSDGLKNKEIYIETLAYLYADRAPEGLKIDENVIIRYCSGNDCFYHQITDENCPINARAREKLSEWKAVAKNVFLWDYSLNYCMPIAFDTVFGVIAGRMKYFADQGVVGIFNNFDVEPVGVFYKLRQYFYCRLLWNPDIDLKNEFIEATDFIYGKAAPYLRKVLSLFYESIEKCAERFCKEEDYLHLGFHLPVSYLLEKLYYSDEFLNSARSLYEQAVTESDNAEIRLLVKKEFAYFKFIEAYFIRTTDRELMNCVLKEFDDLNISFGKLDAFKRYFCDGAKDDFFDDEIALRNRKRYYEAQRIRV